MKYCEHCGAEIDDKAVVCVKCGCAVKSSNKQNSGLLLAAKILMIISCAATPCIGLFTGISILSLAAIAGYGAAMYSSIIIGIAYIVASCIPLAWCLPMTLTLNRKIKNHESVGIAFKICTLIFVNTIAGILLLCASEDN